MSMHCDCHDVYKSPIEHTAIARNVDVKCNKLYEGEVCQILPRKQIKVRRLKLCLCLTNEGLRHENVWGAGIQLMMIIQ
jgi:hypothetical protein